VAVQLVEEARDGLQRAGGGDLVVDVAGDGQVQDAQAERGEDHGLVGGRGGPAGEDVVEGAVDEVAVTDLLLGQVGGRVGLHAVLDVVHDVAGRQDDLGGEVAQGDVQDEGVVREPARVGDVRLAGDGGEDDQVRGAEQRLGRVVNRDLALGRASGRERVETSRGDVRRKQKTTK